MEAIYTAPNIYSVHAHRQTRVPADIIYTFPGKRRSTRAIHPPNSYSWFSSSGILPSSCPLVPFCTPDATLSLLPPHSCLFLQLELFTLQLMTVESPHCMQSTFCTEPKQLLAGSEASAQHLLWCWEQTFKCGLNINTAIVAYINTTIIKQEMENLYTLD